MDLVIEHDVPVAMRDGVELATDVYRPAGGEPVPALVQRMPYDKNDPLQLTIALDVLRAARAGYAVVVQDVRGRYRSGGAWEPFAHEGPDGADTIAWAAAQPWCSGRVGMVGASYVGAAQWLAAAERPPALGAIAPLQSSADWHGGWLHQGGALQLGFLAQWILLALAPGEFMRAAPPAAATGERFGALLGDIDAGDAFYDRLPLAALPLDDLAPYWERWLAHPSRDAAWEAVAPPAVEDAVAVPSLNVGGWHDLFLAGTLASYRAARRRADAGELPAAPRLVIGPWSHGQFWGDFPERAYGLMGSAAAADVTGMQLRWFDRHLKDREDALADDAPVRIFVMGADEWRDFEDWPPPAARFADWHLHSGGHANTAAGDGTLAPAPPAEDEPPDVYAYDPHHPVPTVGGATFLPGVLVPVNGGPRDQRPVERRHDVLCYTSAPLERPLEVIGPLELILHASSSARDTDFVARLVDVHPDGRAELLAEGILRARYRRSFAEPQPLEPDRVEELRIDLVATANVFAAGHRIRLLVTSGSFPRFDRNTNSGGPIAHETEADFVTAVNRVFHDRARPSRLVLPLSGRDPS